MKKEDDVFRFANDLFVDYLDLTWNLFEVINEN